MRANPLILLILSSFTGTALAAQSLYCPERQGYINVGMTVAQVVSACGQPMSKQESDRPVTQRVPVKQLIYIDLNKGGLYQGLDSVYSMWSLPSGSKGVSVEIDIINNKVSAVNINGGSNNSMSICQGGNVGIGDDESQVYTACGSANMVNNTFINQMVPSKEKPQVWVYQVNQYQAPVSLTFVDGKLQSIN